MLNKKILFLTFNLLALSALQASDASLPTPQMQQSQKSLMMLGALSDTDNAKPASASSSRLQASLAMMFPTKQEALSIHMRDECRTCCMQSYAACMQNTRVVSILTLKALNATQEKFKHTPIAPKAPDKMQ